jgi:RNA polymerase sigma factor (sigma-70 family)
VIYSRDSLEGRFLAGDTEAVATVSRWIATVLTSTSFLSLRRSWLDLHEASMALAFESLALGRFVPGRDLRLYVQAIARYTARRAMQRPREIPVDEVSAATLTGPADPMSQTVDVLMVKEILARLSEGCRSLLASYFLEGKSHEEISASLEVPVGTVKSRLFRCLAAARRDLERRIVRGAEFKQHE